MKREEILDKVTRTVLLCRGGVKYGGLRDNLSLKSC